MQLSEIEPHLQGRLPCHVMLIGDQQLCLVEGIVATSVTGADEFMPVKKYRTHRLRGAPDNSIIFI